MRLAPKTVRDGAVRRHPHLPAVRREIVSYGAAHSIVGHRTGFSGFFLFLILFCK